ncbi:MAG: transposase [Cytophagales bacterium]|nr:transposase [Cytophagales bacterium]
MKNRNLYRNRFKGGSPRLFGYDYANEGFYFITVCTKNRVHHFGKIERNKMIPSDAGEIVREEWMKTSEIRKDMDVLTDEFCLMPNHIHGIIKIGNPKLQTKNPRIAYSNFKINKFGPQFKNLSSIIRGFKGACTVRIRKFYNESFSWQRRFYDHIIRDLTSLENIRTYIRNNPINWTNDEFM